MELKIPRLSSCRDLLPWLLEFSGQRITLSISWWGLMDLDPSLVLGLGSFGMILLACLLGGTISPLEFLTKLVVGPFLCILYHPFRGILWP